MSKKLIIDLYIKQLTSDNLKCVDTFLTEFISFILAMCDSTKLDAEEVWQDDKLEILMLNLFYSVHKNHCEKKIRKELDTIIKVLFGKINKNIFCDETLDESIEMFHVKHSDDYDRLADRLYTEMEGWK